MKTASRVFYALVSAGFVVLWLAVGVDYVRSGQLKALLPDLPMILIFLICVAVAMGLAFFYFYRRGAPGDPNQFGCVLLIALFVVVLVGALILIALGAVFNLPGP